MAISITLISYTAGDDDDDTEDDDDVDDSYVVLTLCSMLSLHSHFLYSPGFFGYMKKIEERTTKGNGSDFAHGARAAAEWSPASEGLLRT